MHQQSNETHDIRESLTEYQLNLLNQFHENIRNELQTEREKDWSNDRCLCRYLRARDWDLKKAEAMFRETLKWRREYKPHLIKAEDVLTELKNDGKMYQNGKDKLGRPILYMKPGKDNTGPSEKEVKIKYLVYCMEKAINAMEESKGVEKLVWLIDFKDHSQLTGISMTKISKEIMDILQNHYPERLGVAFIHNAPWVWTVFWKMLSPFLNDVTKSKVRMVGKDSKEVLDIIDDEHLEKDYGGKSSFRYNFEEHWDKEDKAHPILFYNDEKTNDI